MSWEDEDEVVFKFESLKGRSLTKVTGAVGDDHMFFHCDDGRTFKLYHTQDCCETVKLEDICGDLSDLVGEVLTAEEVSNYEHDKPDEYCESYTWTFYRIGTAKGLVTLRWLGESNGYYSESVEFGEVKS